MPWSVSSVSEERMKFVARLLDGESMSHLCEEFGISRKTGYKIFNRYKNEGVEAFCDRSRRPVRYANQLPPAVEDLIVRLKREKPHWGARKIRALLVKRLDGDVRIRIRACQKQIPGRERAALSMGDNCITHRLASKHRVAVIGVEAPPGFAAQMSCGHHPVQ